MTVSTYWFIIQNGIPVPPEPHIMIKPCSQLSWRTTVMRFWPFFSFFSLLRCSRIIECKNSPYQVNAYDGCLYVFVTAKSYAVCIVAMSLEAKMVWIFFCQGASQPGIVMGIIQGTHFSLTPATLRQAWFLRFLLHYKTTEMHKTNRTLKEHVMQTILVGTWEICGYLSLWCNIMINYYEKRE